LSSNLILTETSVRHIPLLLRIKSHKCLGRKTACFCWNNIHISEWHHDDTWSRHLVPHTSVVVYNAL